MKHLICVQTADVWYLNSVWSCDKVNKCMTQQHALRPLCCLSDFHLIHYRHVDKQGQTERSAATATLSYWTRKDRWKKKSVVELNMRQRGGNWVWIQEESMLCSLWTIRAVSRLWVMKSNSDSICARDRNEPSTQEMGTITESVIYPPGVKRSEREADYSTSCCAKVKNKWSYTSNPPPSSPRPHGVHTKKF